MLNFSLSESYPASSCETDSAFFDAAKHTGLFMFKVNGEYMFPTSQD